MIDFNSTKEETEEMIGYLIVGGDAVEEISTVLGELPDDEDDSVTFEVSLVVKRLKHD